MRSAPVRVGLCVTVLGLLSTVTLSAAEHEGRAASLEEAFADKVKAVEESLARTIDRLEERFSDVLAEIEKLEDRKEDLVEEADEILETLETLRHRLNESGGEAVSPKGPGRAARVERRPRARPRVRPPTLDAEKAGALAMKQYDTDGDGKVAGEELDKAPSLKAAIKELDANHDGAVSAEEVTERINQWKDTKVGRMSVSVRVLYEGKPLTGATVTLEPEKFLGDTLKACEGTTGPQGMTTLSIPDDELPGAAPGLYLVRISKKENRKETIPAKYNAQTTLGQEVALDANGMQEGIVFELK